MRQTADLPDFSRGNQPPQGPAWLKGTGSGCSPCRRGKTWGAPGPWSIFACLAVLWTSPAAWAVPPGEPQVAPASAEAAQSVARLSLPPGYEVRLWAAEPRLANPVAFCLDHLGRVYVAETFRQLKGVEDNRDHADWVDDDLAARTVADRLEFFRRHLGERLANYEVEQDRIRLLEDTDGDGVADRDRVFADGFRSAVEGTGAGVLAHNGSVYYTNIPHLWRLRDIAGDGQSVHRESLHSGYGVRVAFRGHDLHGLCLGPDGRLYFSIGDRGLNVQSREQRQLAYPDQGAVLRCELDGSDLEVVHSGLRNPQELAFDDRGNLFTGDNNSDSGDKARWVAVVPGADSGWRMNFQYLPDRGPWNREKLWQPAHAGQPAWILPPVTHLADGPSGLAYAPGVGFGTETAGRFFLCDFRGAFGGSGIRALKVEPKGAGYEVTENRQFLWQVLATDVDFGPDGALWLSDWVEGWDGPGKGRLLRVASTLADDRQAGIEMARLLSGEFSALPVPRLLELLAHPGRQVRMRAQYELAERPVEQVVPALAGKLASQSKNPATQPIARLHTLWCLGQRVRTQTRRAGPMTGPLRKTSLETVVGLLGDRDPELRAQSACVLADWGWREALAPVLPLLADQDPRVRFQAGLALAKLAATDPTSTDRVGAALIAAVRANDNADVYLRHALVTGLAGLPDPLWLRIPLADERPSVRLAALLACRRLRRPEVAEGLSDSDPELVAEAARAIYDLPMPDQIPALARLRVDEKQHSEATLWRVLGANHRMGGDEGAGRVADMAADSDLPLPLRTVALRLLADWTQPRPRDPVLGEWRPLESRQGEPAIRALTRHARTLLAGPAPLRPLALDAIARLEIADLAEAVVPLINDPSQPGELRGAALRAAARLRSDRLANQAEGWLRDAAPEVRIAALEHLPELNASLLQATLERTLREGTLGERQLAFRVLGRLSGEQGLDLLSGALRRGLDGGEPAGVLLDLREAARAREADSLKPLLNRFSVADETHPLKSSRLASEGGDARRGERIFFEKTEVSCLRCHVVRGRGGKVGPELTKIAVDKSRQELLESIVLPNQSIAKGFESVLLLTTSGRQIAGVLREEDDRQVTLVTAEGVTVSVPKTEIEEQARTKSAMPEDLAGKLTPFELRDLVEYLSTLKP
ncbi:MAG: HEAT repeat domain-containing protein [Planctomycetaceae bacterium]